MIELTFHRIMVLNLLNFYSLIFALFEKIDSMASELYLYNNMFIEL